MKVKEAIDLLQKEDPEEEILVWGTMGGLHKIGFLKRSLIALDVHEDDTWWGAHELLTKPYIHEYSQNQKTTAVIIY